MPRTLYFPRQPRFQLSFWRDRRDVDLVVRWPFFLNLRLGLTQNALWFGRMHGPVHTAFNTFTKRAQ